MEMFLEETRHILEGLQSSDHMKRNAAIVALANANPTVRQMIEEMIAAEIEQAGEADSDDMSDWRTMDSEPFIGDNEN